MLGGSFNPAHDGHRHISLEALARLDLDAVWWLVSPGNPLKPLDGMAPLDDRLAFANTVAHHRKIQVTDIEWDLGTVYTADTLAALTARYPGVRFVWLMGADNLSQIDRWARWLQIFHTVRIAVFDRPGYSLRALAGKAARRFADARIAENRARALADFGPPAWVYLHVRRHSASSTRLRAGGRSPFGIHTLKDKGGPP